MSNLNWARKSCGVFLLWAIAAVALPAQTFTTLYRFCSVGSCPDGNFPIAALVQAPNGSFYGTTLNGGASGNGTIFKISPGGMLITEDSFYYPTTGAGPYAALALGADGNLYGTTAIGGANSAGTIFRVTPGGTLTTVYNFCSVFGCTDGNDPIGGLVQATDGNFYGTTIVGGVSNPTCTYLNGCGTVFKITPSGTLTMLHSFRETDGLEPNSALIQATDGYLYGTTFASEPNETCTYGCGTIFKITPSGAFTTLHVFNGTDGESPYSGLVQGTDGNFYGTTSLGGANGDGTIFQITPGGSLTTLHSFDGTDGASPLGNLIQATDGNFYGTTVTGGPNDANGCGYGEIRGCGTAFVMTPSGILTTIHNFCSTGGANCTDGSLPEAALIQSTNGNFYGTTFEGGSPNHQGTRGTVFGLSVGLAPFVVTMPTSGKVSAAIRILGNNLTGTTSVTFNGTAAVFTVNSPSLITTAVPAGATTGTVQVVTPSTTLSSNMVFRVRP